MQGAEQQSMREGLPSESDRLMISVVVCTRNDEQTVEWCLDSLTRQDCTAGFEVVVLDDDSSDRTRDIVSVSFPQFRLIATNRRRGWVTLLRKNLSRLQGDVLAFLGPHCHAHDGWLFAVEKEMAESHPVITGWGHHGEERLLQRFEALTTHPDFIGQDETEVDFLWDDNFAILPEVLGKALPRSETVLSDGAGSVLLSFRLRRMGIHIRYRPSIKIDHITHPFRELMGIWYGEMATNAIAIKREDRDLPGARLLWLGPAIAMAFAVSRWRQGIGSLLRARHGLSTSWFELGLHAGILACLMPAYFVGLCREIFLARDRM